MTSDAVSHKQATQLLAVAFDDMTPGQVGSTKNCCLKLDSPIACDEVGIIEIGRASFDGLAICDEDGTIAQKFTDKLRSYLQLPGVT